MDEITSKFEQFKTARDLRRAEDIRAEIQRVDTTMDNIQSVDPSDDQIRYGHIAIVSKKVMLRLLMKYRLRLVRSLP